MHLFPVAFLDFSAWRVRWGPIPEWVKRKTTKPSLMSHFTCSEIIKTQPNISFYMFLQYQFLHVVSFLQRNKAESVHTGAPFAFSAFIVYPGVSMSLRTPFKEAVVSGILCKPSARARSSRSHLIDPRESAWTLPPPPSPSLIVRSGPPLRALGLASDKLRRSAGSPKVRQICLEVPGLGPEWFGVCFSGDWGYIYFFLHFLVFLQFRHGDSQRSPCAAMRFPGWDASADPRKQVCG